MDGSLGTGMEDVHVTAKGLDAPHESGLGQEVVKCRGESEVFFDESIWEDVAVGMVRVWGWGRPQLGWCEKSAGEL